MQIVGQPIDYVIMVGYVVVLVAFGSMFGAFTKSTKDFFLAGQRFPWWLVAMSAVATTVGSYSFIKYAAAGFNYGLASTQTYLNDFFLIPLWMFTWLPIIYFARVTSIPEYLERRFDRSVRLAAVVVMMLYLIGYIGINLYTMGTAANALVGWPVFTASVVIAAFTSIYVVAGGQTSVIMTDLLQGFILLGAGIVLFILGVRHMGGFSIFWKGLAPQYRVALPAFNTPQNFNFVGIFWQDAIASTGAFYFMNQGLLLRYLSLKSVKEGRKCVLAIMLVMMPLATFAVCNAGWVGRSMVSLGMLDAATDANKIFVIVANLVCKPGVFGFIMAALLAALMSTADTLINATAAIWVNDIWKPYIRPDAEDRHYLSVARWASIAFTLAGIALVPVFARFKSIYVAHGSFTAAVTPPMIVTILFAAFWKRYHSKAALATLVGGTLVTFLSVAWPAMITPIAHGVDPAGGYKYMRALFSLLASGLIGVLVTFLASGDRDQESKVRGLVSGTLDAAKTRYKGGKPNEVEGEIIRGRLRILEGLEADRVVVNPTMAKTMAALDGDLVFLEDARWWLGGLRGVQTHLAVADGPADNEFQLSPALLDEGNLLADRPVRLEKLL